MVLVFILLSLSIVTYPTGNKKLRAVKDTVCDLFTILLKAGTTIYVDEKIPNI